MLEDNANKSAGSWARYGHPACSELFCHQSHTLEQLTFGRAGGTIQAGQAQTSS